MMRTCGIALAILLGVALGAQGGFGLVSPSGWYAAFRGVAACGASQYSLRDMRMIVMFLASGLLAQGAHPVLRALLVASPALWLSGQASSYF